MPRLSSRLLHKVRAIDPLLPHLFRQCRDLRAAQNELRWLHEHVGRTSARDAKAQYAILKRLVHERGTGKPLQYILGSEYFGDLEIKCQPGVLIPRQDTAASVTFLTQLLRHAQKMPDELRLLDLCTGTGCIPLLFRHELKRVRPDQRLRCLGVDIAKEAIALSKKNLQDTSRAVPTLSNGVTDFIHADALIDPFDEQTLKPPSLKAALNFKRMPVFWDILISNPPYISPSSYWKTTTRSVRNFEPKLALVPPSSRIHDIEEGDAFYPRLLSTACEVEAKIVLFEVADLDQAIRVASMADRLNCFDGIEIWRDQPDGTDTSSSKPESNREAIPIEGVGNGRSVLCWRGVGTHWLGREHRPSRISTHTVAEHKATEHELSSAFVIRKRYLV